MASECLICLTPTKTKINKYTPLYSTTTKHYYVQNCKCTVICHPSCMEKWMNVTPNCLICRKPLGIKWSFQKVKAMCVFVFYNRRIRILIVMAIYLKMVFYIYDRVIDIHCKNKCIDK
jgi:hypothetical protein